MGRRRHAWRRVLDRRRRLRATRVDRYRRRGWLRTTYRWRVVQSDVAAAAVLGLGAARPPRLGERQKAALAACSRAEPLDERTLRRQSGVSGRRSRAASSPPAPWSSPTSLSLRRSPGRAAAAAAAPTAAGAAARSGGALAIVLARRQAAARGAPARRDRQRQDRGLPARRRRAAGAGAAPFSSSCPRSVSPGRRSSGCAQRFPGEQVAVLHSGLSAGERLEAYRARRRGPGAHRDRRPLGRLRAVARPRPDRGRRGARLLVQAGERAALRRPHRRPLARAGQRGGASCCGSATPSVEAFARVAAHADLDVARRRLAAARSRDRRHARLTRRALAAARRARSRTRSRPARRSILFLNRRGLRGLPRLRTVRPHLDVSALRRHPHAVRPRPRPALPHLRPQRAGAGAVRQPAAAPTCARFGFGTERLEREVATCCPASSCCASTATLPRRSRACRRCSIASPRREPRCWWARR